MKRFGVYVPEQDAAWETHDNGALFEDLLERHNRCDAVDCVCPEGREMDEDYTLWEIVSILPFCVLVKSGYPCYLKILIPPVRK